MLQGPNQIYKCPNCDNLISKASIVSGNTYGEKTYSDGKRIAPMLPDFPNLTKCKKCDTIFWLSKLEEIGSYFGGKSDNPAWGKADPANFLGIADLFKAILQGISINKEEEKTIRQYIWWAYNDRIRADRPIFQDDTDELRWTENIQILKTFLDPSDLNEQIMIAELNRNLGDFEACLDIIKSTDDPELDWLQEIFINECNNKNRWVVALN